MKAWKNCYGTMSKIKLARRKVKEHHSTDGNVPGRCPLLDKVGSTQAELAIVVQCQKQLNVKQKIMRQSSGRN